MLYQHILTGPKPFQVGVGEHLAYPIHRHPDLELLYCLHGEVSVSIEHEQHTLRAGDLCVIGSMLTHEMQENTETSSALVIIMGPGLLGEYFRNLADNTFSPVYALPPGSALRGLLEETARIHSSGNPFSNLHIMGNLCRIGAMLCEQHKNAEPPVQNLKMVMKIEQALALINNRYSEDITIADAAAASGYSKSNFCAAFKKVTGHSFHHVLNRHRITNACYLLRDTNMPIGEIATAVGFSDMKHLCRVFKEFMHVSPGEFRKFSAQQKSEG